MSSRPSPALKYAHAGLSAAFALVSLVSSFAQAGGTSGGGGDLCEDRIKVVRDDLKKWIHEGGPDRLELPRGVSVARYSETMLAAIDGAKIKCVGPRDRGYPVTVDGTPKACRFDKSPTASGITCDFIKFQATGESDQYVLVHHEYAGLAALESPAGDSSRYDISNQISGYLVDTVVKRLSVQAPADHAPAPGKPVIDPRLFAQIRERYDGKWYGEEGGNSSGEVLRDGRVLVQLSGRLAEFTFSNIPKAAEDILYVPGQGGSGWLNYFDRVGASIACGISSYDLKVNPFPSATCRFTVDAQGKLEAFRDRSAATSNAKPGGYDGWEDGLRDFHWRAPEQFKSSEDQASTSDSGRDEAFARQADTDKSLTLNLYGTVAQALYAKLDARPEFEYWGPGNPHLQKSAGAVWCIEVGTTDRTYKCGVPFNFAGRALPTAQY